MGSLNDAIDAIAQKLGVPTRLWESVVTIESSGDPNRIGDNGSSFGLFQLHRGGQAPSFLSDAQLLDPITNATYGLPAIATAWKQIGNRFDDSLTWWSQFAAISGHPGYDVALDAQVGAQLKQAYDQGGGIALGNTSTGTSSSSSSNTSPSVSSWLGEVGLGILVFLIAVVLVIVAIVLLR